MDKLLKGKRLSFSHTDPEDGDAQRQANTARRGLNIDNLIPRRANTTAHRAPSAPKVKNGQRGNERERPQDAPREREKQAPKVAGSTSSQHQEENMSQPPRASQSMNKDIAGCADLLRQMYALELEAWTLEQNLPGELQERLTIQRRAHILFDEVKRNVREWMAMDVAWSKTEWECILEINSELNGNGARRER